MGIYEKKKKVNTLILTTVSVDCNCYNTVWKRFYSETCLSWIFCNVSPECILYIFFVICQVKMFYIILSNFMDYCADLVYAM